MACNVKRIVSNLYCALQQCTSIKNLNINEHMREKQSLYPRGEMETTHDGAVLISP